MTDENNKACECLNWARASMKFLTDHHENCQAYTKEIETKAKYHLKTIIKHFAEFCSEGDGIPMEYWDDYKAALLFIGDLYRYQKCLEWEKNE